MTKAELDWLLRYLHNHPDLARRLADIILGATPTQQTADVWMTAKEVGDKIGQSSRWVRERIAFLPSHTVEQRGNRGTWYINWTKTNDQLNQMRS